MGRKEKIQEERDGEAEREMLEALRGCYEELEEGDRTDG